MSQDESYPLPADISYQCASYRSQLPAWNLLEDVYVGDRAWVQTQPDGTLQPKANAQRYLPRLPGEDGPDYTLRLSQSHFSDKFAQTCRDFLGLVFNNGVRLVDVPRAITDNWDNLSGTEQTGDRMCADLGLAALRFGHSFSLVDFPAEDSSIVSLADALGAGRHPYWQSITPLQVINWRVMRQAGRNVLSMAVLCYEQTLPEGEFGEVAQTFYLRLTPGRFDTFTLEKQRNGQIRTIYHPDRSGVMGRKVRGILQPFDHIPLVCLYGGDRTGFFSSNPTLYSLAKLNIAHYQIVSDHRQKMHYCCFPSPVRVGGQGDDMVLGPKKIVDVPLGGGFAWAEPNSQSLAMSRIEVQDIEQEMDFLGADYLVKPSDRQAAATTMISAKKIESELYLFASDFAAGITECLRQHALWLGLPSGGRCELQTKFFSDLASDPQLLLAYLRMHELEAIDRTELRELASATKFFPDTFLGANHHA